MKVLDLFAGLRGWSGPWAERGHEVLTLDFDPKFESDITMDILEFDPEKHLPEGWRPDVILASPPCEGFTVMNIGRNWTKPTDDPPNAPKTDAARMALAIATKTRQIIDEMQPRFFVIENPVAKLRRLPPVQGLENVTVTYCKYGMTYRKPTDLWGGFPTAWLPHPACSPDRGENGIVIIDDVEWRVDRHTGAPCHHVAERGSRKGIQAEHLSPEERAKIPEGLSRDLCIAVERDLAGVVAW
jgi:hypothetical protein